jgi:hypothetical protein
MLLVPLAAGDHGGQAYWGTAELRIVNMGERHAAKETAGPVSPRIAPLQKGTTLLPLS